MDSVVLCYSGGLDSYALSKMYEYDKYLFFNLGTEDNKQELKHIRENRSPEFLAKFEVIDLPIFPYELDNKIIPFRNHLIGLLAAQFGNIIHFGFTAGDTTKDKDYIFKSQMEGIMNYFALDQHKVSVTGYPYQIVMPLKGMTKSQIVKELVSDGISVEEILAESRSCYSGGKDECGRCKSCYRKYQAFMKAGYEIPVDKAGYEAYIKTAGNRGAEFDEI